MAWTTYGLEKAAEAVKGIITSIQFVNDTSAVVITVPVNDSKVVLINPASGDGDKKFIYEVTLTTDNVGLNSKIASYSFLDSTNTVLNTVNIKDAGGNTIVYTFNAAGITAKIDCELDLN